MKKAFSPLRDNRLAQAFLEALLPPHPELGSPDPRQILDRVEYWLGRYGWSRSAYVSLLQALDWQCRLRRGKSLAGLPPEERADWLTRQWQSPLGYPLLSGASLPLKLAYLSQPDIGSRAGQRLPPPISTAETARWEQQLLRPDDLVEDGRLEVDVAVIGSGAGGAMAAYELASRGLAVLILEEGDYFQRSDFIRDPLTQIYRLYRNHGLTGTIGNAVLPIPLGKAVGGTTVVNSGTCLRTPPAVLAEWHKAGLTDCTEALLSPYFDEVESLLQVQPADRAHVGPIADIISRGARGLGLSGGHVLMRNAAGCDGQGLCQFGCPTGAKQSTNVSVIPRALDHGAALMPRVRVERLERRGRRITGLTARDLQSDRTFRVEARAVVAAAGSLLTPLLLNGAGIKNRWLGRNLSVHPAGVVTAWFPGMDFGNTRTIPQGFGLDDLAADGILFEGGTPPLAAMAAVAPGVGHDFTRAVARYRETAFFGFMIRDQSRGRVYSAGRRNYPVVSYRLNGEDFRRFRQGIDTLARIYLAAGAPEVMIPGHRKLPLIRSEKDLKSLWRSHPQPRDFLMTAYHPLGTARIASNPARGVCDPDHEVFGLEGLFVMDGAAVPSSLGANPQVTIMTLALRAARKLAQRLGAAH